MRMITLASTAAAAASVAIASSAEASGKTEFMRIASRP
jgi:hypothetical protein